MRALGITTDSSSDMTLHQSRSLDVPVTPIIVRVGEQETETGPAMDREAYFDAIVQKGLAGTAAVSPAKWAGAYRDLAQRSTVQLAVTLSQEMSATWQSARVAGAQQPSQQVFVFDSGTVFSGLLALVLSAGELALDGAGLEEVWNWLTWARPRTFTYMLSPNLAMLHRIGRVADPMTSHSRPWSVVKIEGGRFVPKTTHVDVEEAVRWVWSDLQPDLEDSVPLRLVVDHGRAGATADTVVELMSSRVHPRAVVRVDDGPIMPVLADGFGGVALAVAPLPMGKTPTSPDSHDYRNGAG
jgi:DegV family protein with EDD domain